MTGVFAFVIANVTMMEAAKGCCSFVAVMLLVMMMRLRLEALVSIPDQTYSKHCPVDLRTLLNSFWRVSSSSVLTEKHLLRTTLLVMSRPCPTKPVLVFPL